MVVEKSVRISERFFDNHYKRRFSFYNMLRQFIEDNETLDFLGKIINEEIHHIKELNKLVDRDDEEGKITSDLG